MSKTAIVAISDPKAGGRADVFGAADGAGGGRHAGPRIVVPGATGILDLSRYLDDGWRLVTF